METQTKETVYYKAVFGNSISDTETLLNEAEFDDPETAERAMEPAFEEGVIEFYEVYKVTKTTKEELLKRVNV